MYNKVYIHNIWEGELAIAGTVDFVNKTITTDPNSVVYIHSSYGDVWAWGMSVVDGQLGWNSECVTIATYDENGKVDFGYWGARCSAGAFGYYLTKMVKQ